MAAFLALLAFLQTAGVHVERVSVPGPNGVNLDAALVLPEGQTRAPPIVALHGCGGPFPSRDGQWAVLLAKAGHIVLLPDSFGSRGLGSQCAMKEREVTPAELRRQDAIDTAQWLAARPGSRCRFTMQWTSTDTTQQVIANTQIVDRLELWRAGRNEWLEHVELSKRFHEHLREHAVLPDRRGIAHLSGSSLGLDLYTLLAYRLPRLDHDLHLRWSVLQEQLGTAERTTNTLAGRMREVMPDVMTAYPHAKVDLTPHGLLLKPSAPAVPKATVRGSSLVEG